MLPPALGGWPVWYGTITSANANHFGAGSILALAMGGMAATCSLVGRLETTTDSDAVLHSQVVAF